MVEWYMAVVCGWVCTVCVSEWVGRCRRHSVLHCTSLLHRLSSEMDRTWLRLAQRHENKVKMYQSHEAYMRQYLHLYIAVLTLSWLSPQQCLSTTPGSRGICLRTDIWWKHFSSSREFDFKLSLAPWGSVPLCMHVCVFRGQVIEVAYICICCGLPIFHALLAKWKRHTQGKAKKWTGRQHWGLTMMDKMREEAWKKKERWHWW